MDFRILGPLQALDEDQVVTPRGSKQRSLLALLLLHANETLSADQLIDELWGERPPATAAKTVQVHISRLRKTLTSGSGNGSDGIIVSRDHGYQLVLAPGQLDSHEFEQRVEEGRIELARGRPDLAASALERALALWAGPPLADVAYEPFARSEIARLDDLRTAAHELLIEAQLELGRHDEAVPQLEALIRDHPYRERLRAQLMLALYRCDRQADALQAYHDARRSLLEGLGIEPGERLRELERAILTQDRALAMRPVEVAELPPELDTSTLLAGREAELDWLRGHWQRARRGAGRLVLLAGRRGMGKTRLAAELAGELQQDGVQVLYLSGDDASEAAGAALADARKGRRPTLLVADDVDRADETLVEALRELVIELPGLSVLVVATGEGPELPAELPADAVLELAPLDSDAVRAVAQLYAGGRDDVRIPAAHLVDVSGGIPQRLHAAASEWARIEAARRLGAVATRAANERKGLRLAEDDLAGNVVRLQALRARAGLEDAERVVACPFKGLASFDVEDSDVFHGRERLVAEMVARLTGAPLMGIVGPSGSGKSSALRAGLLAALADGVLPGSENWAQALLRPGEHPLEALEQATAEAASGERMVVAVDQFEEAFATCRDESERAAFVDALVGCARRAAGRRALVLVAVRADFYGRCAVYPELSRLMGANHVLVGPMRRDELRRAIELPARRAGLSVESDLVDALIADVEGEPGGLPLLSTALVELWERRDGRRLRMSAYEQLGGVQAAIARHAENTYARLEPGQQEVARRILLRLAGQGEGESVVRRRVERAELEADRDERVAEALSVLAADRLVTIGAGEVEVAHEALLREWPRLRGWLEEDAEGRRLQLHLGAAAHDWVSSGRDAGELYRGARLASALEWSVTHRNELNASEHAFLDESRAASERSHRRLRTVLAGVVALLVLAVIAGFVALDQRGNARDEALAADAQRLGAQALTEDDLDRALLLARQGVALDNSPQTRGNLLAALLRSPAALGILRGDDEPIAAIALSPDERMLAAGTNSNKVFLFGTRTRQRLATLKTTAGYAFTSEMVFSPDGRRLAVGYDSTPGATVQRVAVFDVRARRLVTRVSPPPGGVITGLGYSPDGRQLELIMGRAFADRGPAEYLRFDSKTGARRFGPAPVNRAGTTSLMLTSDGSRLVAVGQGETVVRDARSLRALRRWPVGGRGVSQFWPTALSPDDRTVAIGGEDGSVRFLDLETGRQRAALGRHVAEVFGAAFTPNGRRLVTTGADNDVILWDVQRAAAGETLSAQPGRVLTPRITRDGRTLYTAGPGAAVLIWDLLGTRRLGRPFSTAAPGAQPFAAVTPGTASLALSSDGGLMARGRDDGAVTIIDAQTLARREPFPAVTGGPVQGLAFVPGSHILVVSGPEGFLAIADVDRGRVLMRLAGHQGDVLPPAVSGDGRLLATAAGDMTVRLWSLPNGGPVGDPLRFERAIQEVQISPDGRRLAVVLVDPSGENGRLEVWNAGSRHRIATLEVPDTPTAVRFSPDGRLLAVGYRDGRSHLWSTENWTPVTRLFAGDVGDIYALAISPDSSMLATGSLDRTVRLWDIEGQHAIGTPLPGPGRGVGAAAPYFTPDGAALIASYDTGHAFRWEIRPAALARHACRVAGRRLTRAEWTEFLPGRDYDPAC
jgi:WD40 repeat protein/DNA-binding SARP family transcriptional activator